MKEKFLPFPQIALATALVLGLLVGSPSGFANERPCEGSNFKAKVSYKNNPIANIDINGSIVMGFGSSGAKGFCGSTNSQGEFVIGLRDGRNWIRINPDSRNADEAAFTEFRVEVLEGQVRSVVSQEGKPATFDGAKWLLELSDSNLRGEFRSANPTKYSPTSLTFSCDGGIADLWAHSIYSERYWGYRLTEIRDCAAAITLSGQESVLAITPVCQYLGSEKSCGEFVIGEPNVNISLLLPAGVKTSPRYLAWRVFPEKERPRAKNSPSRYAIKNINFDPTFRGGSDSKTKLFLADGDYLLYFLPWANSVSGQEVAGRSIELSVKNGVLVGAKDLYLNREYLVSQGAFSIDYTSAPNSPVKLELVENLPGGFLIRFANYIGSYFSIEGDDGQVQIEPGNLIRVTGLELNQEINLRVTLPYGENGLPGFVGKFRNTSSASDVELVSIRSTTASATERIKVIQNVGNQIETLRVAGEQTFKEQVAIGKQPDAALQKKNLETVALIEGLAAELATAAANLQSAYNTLGEQRNGFKTSEGVIEADRLLSEFRSPLELYKELRVSIMALTSFYRGMFSAITEAIKAKQSETSATPSETPKPKVMKMIKCVKGKKVRYVTATKPKCPAGYKKG